MREIWDNLNSEIFSEVFNSFICFKHAQIGYAAWAG